MIKYLQNLNNLENNISPNQDSWAQQDFSQSAYAYYKNSPSVVEIEKKQTKYWKRNTKPVARVDLDKCVIGKNGYACATGEMTCKCPNDALSSGFAWKAYMCQPDFIPTRIDSAKCVGCGECVNTCATNAIKIVLEYTK